jgi:hypothetical protein
LPAWAHRPGETAGADHEPLTIAKASIPTRYDGPVPSDDPALLYGLSLYAGGFFWEAHEVWEAVWKAAPMNGPDRIALRALIQLANTGLKLRMGRNAAAARLLAEAAELVTELVARRVRGGLAAALDPTAFGREVGRSRAELGSADRRAARPPDLSLAWRT